MDEPSRDVTRGSGDTEQRVVRAAVELPERERRSLLAWLESLLSIRDSGARPLRKARAALNLQDAAGALEPAARATARLLTDVAWKDRSWETRLGVGAMTLAAATAGGGAAGVAALGAAVGVPLWIVLGTGGGFAATLADELRRSLDTPPSTSSDDGPVVDAEWEFADPQPALESTPSDRPKEPLWQVFRRAYRDARARQNARAE